MKDFHMITEGKATCYVPREKKISKDLPTFYNPLMEYNRTITIALLKATKRKSMLIALPLEGTGIRAMRLCKELPINAVQRIDINDHNPTAKKIIRKNQTENNIAKETIHIFCKDANEFLINQQTGYDYIDIDPFGSPNPFLNSAITRLKRDGILAVTATDTASLCGTNTYPCLRKYWAHPLHTEEMHEVGLRILIRKIQLIAMQYDRALHPILSYSKDHYMRVFLTGTKSKEACNAIIKQHATYKGAGPLWTGKLYDKKILSAIQETDTFTETLKNELDILGFYELPTIYGKEKIPKGKPIQEIITALTKKKYKAARTHFALQGIKTDAPYNVLTQIIKTK